MTELVVVGGSSTLARQAVAFSAELGYDARLVSELAAETIERVAADEVDVFIALDDDGERANLIDQLVLDGTRLTNIVHPTAWVSPSARLGENVMIGPQCVVAMDAAVGNGVVLNALSSIEHDNVVGPHTFLGTGVTLCGRITIGAYASLGGGAVVKPGLTVGARCVLGTGAVLVKDAEPGLTYVGNPARPL